MCPVPSSIPRIVAAALLVAFVPIELGGPVAAESVLEADDCVDHHQLHEMHVEVPDQDAVDFLEVEDDDAWMTHVFSHATSARTLTAAVHDSPAHVHLEDLERPPRA